MFIQANYRRGASFQPTVPLLFRVSQEKRFRSCRSESGPGCGDKSARTSHKLATTTSDASVLTSFYLVGLLDVLPKYACGGLLRKPCQNGASTVSLRRLIREMRINDSGYPFRMSAAASRSASITNGIPLLSDASRVRDTISSREMYSTVNFRHPAINWRKP